MLKFRLNLFGVVQPQNVTISKNFITDDRLQYWSDDRAGAFNM